MKLTDEEVKYIANCYHDLWRHGAITDKDYEQVKDLLADRQAWKEEAEEWQRQHNHWHAYAMKVEDRLNQAVEVLKQINTWAWNDINMRSGGVAVGTPVFTSERLAKDIRLMCETVLSSLEGGKP